MIKNYVKKIRASLIYHKIHLDIQEKKCNRKEIRRKVSRFSHITISIKVYFDLILTTYYVIIIIICMREFVPKYYFICN